MVYHSMPASKSHLQIDWDAVWKSLNWDDEQRQEAVSHERLRQRAEHYAAPVKEQEVTPENARTVLIFDLGGEQYGIDVIHVRGIRALVAIARVPGAPSFYPGVINVRGRIITVLDLRDFFQIVYAEETDTPHEVMIIHAGQLEIALLAHQVIGVESIPASAIKSVDHMPYAQGLTSDKVILLDIAQLFQDERLIMGGANE
jgi:purine-binding chemotaxis protein CheW